MSRRSAAGGGALVALVALVALLAGCSLGEPDAQVTPNTQSPQPVRYVAIGAEETLGSGVATQRREAWPRLLFREHLPPQAVIVELARPRATVADAFAEQVPSTIDTSPTLVTVWLESADAAIGTPIDDYRGTLTEILTALQGTGARVAVVHGATEADRYSRAAAQVADELGVDAVSVGEQSSQADIAQQIADQLALDG